MAAVKERAWTVNVEYLTTGEDHTDYRETFSDVWKTNNTEHGITILHGDNLITFIPYVALRKLTKVPTVVEYDS